jgi:anaerobic selenocysteine-containing dehydrogenase
VDLATATLHLSAADAASRGIRHADQVRVYNDRGACLLRASVDGRVRPGVVCAPSTRWGKRAPDRHNINALTSERITDFGGGATFYSCLVQVERSGD